MTTQVDVTLIGGPTALIEIAGFRLLSDPTFDQPGEYPGAVTLEKTEGPAESADDLGGVSAVLLSHDQHFDNLDRAGRGFLERAPVTFTTEEGSKRLGGNARPLKPFETTELQGKDGGKLMITGTPARHGPAGYEPISGPVIGFLIGLEQPGDAIYLTGDTVWYDGIAEVARRYAPRLVIPFVGSAEPRGPFRVTMDSNDAIETAYAFPRAAIAAVHNRGWTHFKESPSDLAKVFDYLGLGSRLTTLVPGQRTRFEI
jgi:L-ascorbate metabolism protein UlaG (beta-lactamase superfamily)